MAEFVVEIEAQLSLYGFSSFSSSALAQAHPLLQQTRTPAYPSITWALTTHPSPL